MQFMSSSLEKLVKNLSHNDFKYFTEEFGSKSLELLKRSAYPYEYIKLPDKECFYSSVKYGTTNDNGKKLDGQISDWN